MTDGFGTVDYTYNQLSALNYETRTFSDPNNSSINGIIKTLGYDYNLAGELKTLTDPSGSIVTYTNDNAGRVTRVDGSGYGNFSWFASNIQYRAWGGLKHLGYQNNVSLDQQHDGRMRLTRYALSSPNYGELWLNRAQNYQYYNDSSVKFMGDEADNRFDRAYGYDQAGQLTQALTGGEARGQEVWGLTKKLSNMTGGAIQPDATRGIGGLFISSQGCRSPIIEATTMPMMRTVECW
jgi:YD repeat-containing protein